MDLLSTTEQQQFRTLIADCYFDYAYSISKTQTRQALSSYSRSNKYAFRPRTCAAMIKTMIKALVPGSSRS
jgi:hypothetical protein